MTSRDTPHVPLLSGSAVDAYRVCDAASVPTASAPIASAPTAYDPARVHLPPPGVRAAAVAGEAQTPVGVRKTARSDDGTDTVMHKLPSELWEALALALAHENPEALQNLSRTSKTFQAICSDERHEFWREALKMRGWDTTWPMYAEQLGMSYKNSGRCWSRFW